MIYNVHFIKSYSINVHCMKYHIIQKFNLFELFLKFFMIYVALFL